MEEIAIRYDEALKIGNERILPAAIGLYGLEGYDIQPVGAHDGGRNVVYTCEPEGANADAKILRISFLGDRSRELVLAELEFVRYLAGRGGNVADVIPSRNGQLMEEIVHDGQPFFICLFRKARGKQLSENHYRYREGAPLSEYFHNCGKVLGRLHQLSKGFNPVHRRYGFFDKFNAGHIDSLIPDSFRRLKEKLVDHLKSLDELDQSPDVFGLVHFDYSDGNYSIDYDTGRITVYDFDNCCYCWYMYDLANVWAHGVGWVQFEPDAGKRKAFMEDYFETVLAGYRTETKIGQAMLEKLPLFIQTVLMENILDAFETMRNSGEDPEDDEELMYRIKCIEEDIPYLGFFHEMYSCEHPFEHEP